jgi:hypothetical protein
VVDLWVQKFHPWFVTSQDDAAIELGEYIGASSGSRQRLTLYVPTEDRSGHAIAESVRDLWFQRAIELLTRIGGGATVMPCLGAWFNSELGKVIQERVDVVYTFLRAKELDENRVNLRRFLHRLGIETNQGEVAFEFDGRFYRIDEFDPEELEGDYAP